jgi:hypothetical protein
MIQERSSSLHRPACGKLEAGRTLNLAVIYEDAETCKWARETCERLLLGAGRECIRSTWWKLDELREPAVLAGAVSKAMRADMIVVASRATEGFPLPFYVWVRSWLPHHPHGAGKFVALTITPWRNGGQRNRAVEYLRAVARRARMDFEIIERQSAWQMPWIAEERSRRLWRAAKSAPNRLAGPLRRHAVHRYRMPD